MRTVFFRTPLAVAILMVMAPAAIAQDTLNCGDFEFQEDAQAVYDADPSDPHGLDGSDNDGIACESLPPRGSAAPSEPTAPTGTDTTDGAAGSGTSGQTPAGGVPTGAGGTAASGLPSLQLLVGMAGAMGAAGLTALAFRARRG